MPIFKKKKVKAPKVGKFGGRPERFFEPELLADIRERFGLTDRIGGMKLDNDYFVTNVKGGYKFSTLHGDVHVPKSVVEAMIMRQKEKEQYPPVGTVAKKAVHGYPVDHMYVGGGRWVRLDERRNEYKGFEQQIPEEQRRYVRDHQGYKGYISECIRAGSEQRQADMDETDARLYMWQNVINLPDGVKRLVARVHEWEGRNSRDDFIPDTGKYELFVPTSWADRFELVTTLGTDGNTYPVYDIDCKLESLPYHMWDDCLIVPSTDNFHGYEQSPHNWTQFLEKHEKALPDNEGYLIMNRDKGWAGVRPPWHRKDFHEFEHTAASRSHNWINFNPPQGNDDQSGEKKDDRPMSLAEMFETV